MSSNAEKLDVYAAAEQHHPGYGAVAAVWKGSLGLYEVTLEPHKGGRDLRVMFTRDGVPAGFAGKARSSRDHETELKPGFRNPARRAKARKRPSIGRRKTVRMSAKGLISRRSQKAVKRALHREAARSKMLPCPFCARKDFITEKSLKSHIGKFHTPGVKSLRGYRTRRDEE
jgi:hypothetical protein